MSEFQRSNLTIQPKQRLMSAGSFISPVRTYDANEQMRIMESFRGLSAQSDALIDSFIKKKQEEGQAKADMYMTDALLDPNHPEHKKAKEMMDSLKPQAVNLLGVDYWTQQYIWKAQSEQLYQKEKAAMELGYVQNGDANKSPDEYVKQLAGYRAEIEKEVATYPKEVQKLFYMKPRQELMNAMRDRHIKDLSAEQIKLRDNIAANKTYNTLVNSVDGLSALVYNTPDLKDETLGTVEYGKYVSNKVTKKEAENVARLFGWQGNIDNAGKFMPVEQQKDILLYRKLSSSSMVEHLLENIREMAEAGMKPDQIKQSVYNGFIRMVQDNEDLGDEADILFNIVMDRANQDGSLLAATNSWGYVINNNTEEDHNIAMFDMADIAVKGKSLRQIAVQSAGLKQAEYEAKQIKDRQTVWAFLNDAELAGKISKEDIQYGKQLGYTLKLLAIGKNTDDGIEVRVHPTYIKSTHPLASVKDSYNAVYITGDCVEDVMLYGRGAGAMPTASAIVGDVIYCATHPTFRYSTFKNTPDADPSTKFIDNFKSAYYIRLAAHDKTGVLAKVSSIFSRHNISVAQMIQEEEGEDGRVPIVFVTHVTKEKSVNKAVDDINDTNDIADVLSVIRVV